MPGDEGDDAGEVLAEQQKQSSGRPYIQGQHVVVETALQQLPVDVPVEALRFGLTAVRHQQTPAVAVAGRPREEVPQFVSGAGACG
ncbi:hypothetical protein [Streptomyces yangpuensis]|uniref:hypothetical protein n=1 Tax=Streptomyces yangpuensis TaxID=1648182 RepID=UPI0036D0E4C5